MKNIRAIRPIVTFVFKYFLYVLCSKRSKEII